VIQDPTDLYIATILSRCDLSGKHVLEIGCGKGRITLDLAKHARFVVATDPDEAALKAARTSVAAGNVTFLHTPSGMPDFPAGSFDLVIYTLSLHHLPVDEMSGSLQMASRLLRNEGVIVLVEPGEGGSFTEAKERFGAGSGDERPAREAAIRAMHALEGWRVAETVHFRTLFRFVDDEDFFSNMLADYRSRPKAFVNEVRTHLSPHRTVSGIILDADRQLSLLRRV
jgi:SAM-dependent methyltransferase